MTLISKSEVVSSSLGPTELTQQQVYCQRRRMGIQPTAMLSSDLNKYLKEQLGISPGDQKHQAKVVSKIF